jgi:riboflavin synthase
MAASSRFGGHIVQGHVDGRGRLERVERDSRGIRVTVGSPPELRRYIVDRGSVAVDGVSLTVVSVTTSGFALYIIPETLQKTVLGEWKAGDAVNLEVDILAKYVERMLQTPGNVGEESGDGGLKRKLAEEGYL